MSFQLINPEEVAFVRTEDADLLDTEDVRWKLANRVAESPSFANAPLLSKFLLFVCECTLSNRVEELTERNIGIVVFQRRPGYKTSEDSIVRSYVRQLRLRLNRYFEEHELDEPMRIVIPRGGYCAVFEDRTVASPIVANVSSSPMIETIPLADSRPRRQVNRYQLGSIFLAGLLIGMAALFWGARYFTPTSPAHSVWVELFSRPLNAYIVSADSGLAIIEELTGKHITLEQYIDGSYFAQFGKTGTEEDAKLQRLSGERFTGVPDVNTAAGIIALPKANGAHISLRNSRTVSLDDIKNGNQCSRHVEPGLFQPGDQSVPVQRRAVCDCEHVACR